VAGGPEKTGAPTRTVFPGGALTQIFAVNALGMAPPLAAPSGI